jgi:hypothetical protein
MRTPESSQPLSENIEDRRFDEEPASAREARKLDDAKFLGHMIRQGQRHHTGSRLWAPFDKWVASDDARRAKAALRRRTNR